MTGMIHKETFAASVLDFDEKVLIRPLTYYGWMLTAAARHCVPLRLTGPDMNAMGLTWIITHFSVIFDRFHPWNVPIIVETWPQELKGFKTRRDYRLVSESGEPAAAGASNWCLLDLKTRKPVPMDRIGDRLVDCHPEEAIAGWKGERLESPLTGMHEKDESDHRVSYGDLDFNDHCTNIRYVEWAWNALTVDFQKKNRPVRLDVQFMSEAFAGDRLIVSTRINDGTTLQSLSGSDGATEYCRVKTVWRPRKDGE